MKLSTSLLWFALCSLPMACATSKSTGTAAPTHKRAPSATAPKGRQKASKKGPKKGGAVHTGAPKGSAYKEPPRPPAKGFDRLLASLRAAKGKGAGKIVSTYAPKAPAACRTLSWAQVFAPAKSPSFALIHGEPDSNFDACKQSIKKRPENVLCGVLRRGDAAPELFVVKNSSAGAERVDTVRFETLATGDSLINLDWSRRELPRCSDEPPGDVDASEEEATVTTEREVVLLHGERFSVLFHYTPSEQTNASYSSNSRTEELEWVYLEKKKTMMMIFKLRVSHVTRDGYSGKESATCVNNNTLYRLDLKKRDLVKLKGRELRKYLKHPDLKHARLTRREKSSCDEK